MSTRDLTRALCIAVALGASAPALARTPPIALDPKEGVWMGAGDRFILQSRDQWSVFGSAATVNKLAADGLTLWIATDDGVVRFETGSRSFTKLSMDDGLPSQAVSAVAVDDQYVWFATNKGLARYRKIDRTIRVYGEEHGLPHRAVNDALTVGRQVWFATRAGIALYDPETDGLRAFTAADGLAGEDVAELFQVGDDLWCRTDAGLSRFRPKSRNFANFSFKDLGGEQIRVFVLEGERIWIGTENGLVSVETSSDTIVPFPQQAALKGKGIVGVEPFTDYLFIATDEEVVQYHKISRSMRRYTEAEGLSRQAGAVGTVLSGGLLTLLFSDGAEVFDIQRELWSARTLAPTGAPDEGLGLRLFGRLNSEEPIDVDVPGPFKNKLRKERFATFETNLAFGRRLEGGRSFEAAVPLDYGQVELPGVRDLQYKVEYLGNNKDVLREARIEDKHKYRGLEEGLERPLLLQGGKARVASQGDEPAAQLSADVGQRRGVVVRDFLTGPRQEIYPLSKRYILPGSERVYVDGELLTNGTDYTVIYPAGQLAFLDPERVDDLSIIEVEYEYDLVPKKGLGVLSLLDLLPADREVGDWTRSGQARLISEESGLYAQIDGAAPKYIDRGWTRSVYAEYRQGSRSIQVAIHDMGDEVNADSIYQFDLPAAREPVPGHENLVLDLGLATSYTARSHTDSYYIELSIDEKTDAAKQSLKLFAIQILDRGTNAGEHTADQVREWLLAARAATSPAAGWEFGARALELMGDGEGIDGSPARRLFTGAADARFERAVGEGGRLTAYSELAGTHGQNDGDPDGFGAMGRVRLSTSALEGNLSARHQSAGYSPLGSKSSYFGTLRDEARLSATAYPARWLPATAFYTRQLSELEDGSSGTLQQALARMQLARDGLPAASLQVGHTLLDGAGETTGRIKGVGQIDYDLAQGPLSFLGFKRFSLRGLYGVSQAATESGGSFAHNDRVQLARLEAKVAPTATESAYALFRSRTLGRQDSLDERYGLSVYHWELNSGARSAIVPGLIPQLNYTVLFDDDRTAAPFRAAKASVAGALGVYPGQWWSPLTPLVIEPRYSVTNDEKSESELRTLFKRVHRVDNRAVWAGGGRWELEFYEVVELGFADSNQHLDSRKLEMRNRLVFRPTFASPITARFNYQGQHALNDLTLAPGAPPWARAGTYETVLEWLMRWNKTATTKLKSTYSWGNVKDRVVATGVPGLIPTPMSYVQRRAGVEAELRLFPLEEAQRLFVLQRDRVYRLFGDGAGSTEALGFDVAAGAIWTMGDNLYLDGEVAFRKMSCLAEPCTPIHAVEPRLLFTFNL